MIVVVGSEMSAVVAAPLELEMPKYVLKFVVMPPDWMSWFPTDEQYGRPSGKLVSGASRMLMAASALFHWEIWLATLTMSPT